MEVLCTVVNGKVKNISVTNDQQLYRNAVTGTQRRLRRHIDQWPLWRQHKQQQERLHYGKRIMATQQRVANMAAMQPMARVATMEYISTAPWDNEVTCQHGAENP